MPSPLSIAGVEGQRERKRKRPLHRSSVDKGSPTDLSQPIALKRPRGSPTDVSVTSAPKEMYSFTSRYPQNGTQGTVVDLTASSPPASPLEKAPTRPAAARNGFNPHTGPRKLVVKNLKQNSAWDPKVYLEKTWGQLQEALEVIFKNNEGELGSSFSKEVLYRGVENVCRQGGARTLFDRLESSCREHIRKDTLQPLLAKCGEGNIAVLEDVLDRWRGWKAQMATITMIFFFMDRSYLLSSSKPTLGELAPQLFRDIIFSNTDLKSKIINGACDIVAVDRTNRSNGSGKEGKLNHTDTIAVHDSEPGTMFKCAVDMFNDLAVYTASFEPRFLGLTQDYVATQSDVMSESLEVRDYVRRANEMMAQEMSRFEEFALAGSTKRDLLTLLEDHLISRKEAYLEGQDALADLLDDNAVDDIAALYTILARRRLGTKLRPALEKWVDDKGTSIVFAKEADDMVVQLLSLKRSLDFMWRTAFQRDVGIGHGIRDSFAAFINKTKKGESTWGTDNTKVGEMIAKYVDQLLRGGVKAIPVALNSRRASSFTSAMQAEAALRRASSATSTAQVGATLTKSNTLGTLAENAEAIEDNEDVDIDEDEEVNIQLDQVLDLFRFLEGKAVFEAFYKKDLARRLLMGRSASADAERSMLARLKTECGSGFTQNLEQMFKDIELAREELQSYKTRLEDRVGSDYKAKQLDLDVKVLSAAAWPTYPDIPVRIPLNVQRATEDFEMHYKIKHSGRKLEWKHALAHCQMRASFGLKAKELVVSSFQAIVLLLFNGVGEKEHLTYQHILTETGLPEKEVKRTLQSLACAKLRPLTKHPKGREINDTDTFTVDASFDHPKYRVKINQVQLKETKEENKETHIRVAEDRNFECQAAIVRIMKSKKVISHAELVSDVIEATRRRGVMSVADIKKNIDRLIEKDYMERMDGNKYSYLA